MNKQELIQDLQSKDFVDSINGDATLQEVKQDGGKWYIQNIRELQSGSVATYRNVSFYVVDEGLPTEVAYYQDKIPVAITNKILSFTEKVNKYADTHENIDVEKCEEDRQFAVVKKYAEINGQIVEKRFLVKLINDVVTIKEIV
jgi:hypothetical protein